MNPRVSPSIPKTGPVSTEDFIILALSRRSPLSAKELYLHIKRQGFDVSYQAVHKKLRELVAEGVLIDRNKRYQINREWILNTKCFLESMDKELIKSSEKIERREAICLSFDSYNDFATHMLEEFVKEREQEPGGICVTCQKHFYWIFSVSKRDYDLLKKLGSGGKSYIVCEGKSFVDKILAPIYQKLGWKVVTGVN
jgi:Fe2+ or Zn2+ uptake regulation protein